jgi:hypothetical protein
MITNFSQFADTAIGWQRALYAFLAEKEQRSYLHGDDRGALEMSDRLMEIDSGFTSHDKPSNGKVQDQTL